MDDILEWLGRIGAWLILVPLGFGLIAGPVAAGWYAAKHTSNKWVPWVVGIVSLVLFLAVFAPTYSAVKRASCHGVSDYEGCMDDEGDGD